VRNKYFDYKLNENGIIVSYGSRISDYQTDVLTRKAVDFISRQAAEAAPFFLLLTPKVPHMNEAALAVPAPRHDGSFADLELPNWQSFNEADVSDKPGFLRTLPPMNPTISLSRPPASASTANRCLQLMIWLEKLLGHWTGLANVARLGGY
jgi:hypothetical protein